MTDDAVSLIFGLAKNLALSNCHHIACDNAGAAGDLIRIKYSTRYFMHASEISRDLIKLWLLNSDITYRSRFYFYLLCLQLVAMRARVVEFRVRFPRYS